MHCFHCNSKLYTPKCSKRVQDKLFRVWIEFGRIFYRTVARCQVDRQKIWLVFFFPHSNCVYIFCLDNITNMIIIRNERDNNELASCTQIQSAFAWNCYIKSSQQRPTKRNTFNMNWKCQNSRKFCKLLDTIADTRRCFYSSEMNMEK